MKRRDFIHRAGLFTAVLPLAAYRTPVSELPAAQPAAEVGSHNLQAVRPENMHGPSSMCKIFTDTASQTEHLKKLFAHRHWQHQDIYMKAWARPTRINVSISNTHTVLSDGLTGYMLVSPGAEIIIHSTGNIQIKHESPSGNQLDWQWKPAYRWRVLGVDQEQSTLKYHFRLGSHYWGDGLADWDKIEHLMRKHQIQLCVVDKYPESVKTSQFQRRFYGHVIVCRYQSRGKDGRPVLETSTDHCGVPSEALANRSYWYRGDHSSAYCDIAETIMEGKNTYEQQVRQAAIDEGAFSPEMIVDLARANHVPPHKVKAWVREACEKYPSVYRINS